VRLYFLAVILLAAPLGTFAQDKKPAEQVPKTPEELTAGIRKILDRTQTPGAIVLVRVTIQ
jgi:hypothetical protein